MDQDLNDSGWRGSAELWLDAAYEALVDAGVDAVKILPLAKKLRLSRTSFYWFFQDRNALLDRLIARWREKNTGNLIGRTQTYAESAAEAMLNVFDCWLDETLFDSRFEFAVRSWGLQSEPILAEVQRADQDRVDALTRMLVRFGSEEPTAEVRARTTYLVQIGYISMQTKEDADQRLERIPDYVEIFTGKRPTENEMARFRARHRPAGA